MGIRSVRDEIERILAMQERGELTREETASRLEALARRILARGIRRPATLIRRHRPRYTERPGAGLEDPRGSTAHRRMGQRAKFRDPVQSRAAGRRELSMPWQQAPPRTRHRTATVGVRVHGQRPPGGRAGAARVQPGGLRPQRLAGLVSRPRTHRRRRVLGQPVQCRATGRLAVGLVARHHQPAQRCAAHRAGAAQRRRDGGPRAQRRGRKELGAGRHHTLGRHADGLQVGGFTCLGTACPLRPSRRRGDRCCVPASRTASSSIAVSPARPS